MPKELTPARRGFPFVFHSDSLVFTTKGLLAKSILGLGCSKCRLGGIFLFSSARTVLMRPATPAASSRGPKFVFTEPMAQKPFVRVLARKTRVRAAISIGSPSAVPVP